MDNTIINRIKSMLPERVASIPVTITLIVIFWVFYLLQMGVRLYYGTDLTMTLFYVRYNHLSYAWTWITATLSHVNLIHLVVNSYIAFWLGGWAESVLGKRQYLGVFFLGGAITALTGTVLAANVSGHLFANLGLVASSQSSSTEIQIAAGSSMGWLTVLGVMLAIDPRGRTSIAGFHPRRWVVFITMFILSAVGTLSDFWLFEPNIGHPFHLVGLVIGGLYGLILSHHMEFQKMTDSTSKISE